MRGPGPGPALIWVGTATEGEDELPARVFLLPPPPPRPDASDSDTTDASSDDTDSADSTDSTDSTDAADSSDSSVDDGTVSESMAFLGRGPGFGPHPPPMGPPHPGELRIGNVILFIKPTSAEIEDAATDSEDGLPRPPRLKSLQAELIRSPRLGPDASDSEDSSEPQSIGTLEFTITAGESEGSPATVSGTATITDPDSGESKTFTLSGEVRTFGPPPPPPGFADASGDDTSDDASDDASDDTSDSADSDSGDVLASDDNLSDGTATGDF